MTFFTLAAVQHLAADDDSLWNPVLADLKRLHQEINAQFRAYHLDLHLLIEENRAVQRDSTTMHNAAPVLSVAYTRSPNSAVTVERLMGREEVASTRTIEARRHPVIELRASETHFSIELVLSPDAWWDQQNLVGKLKVSEHRQELYTLLQALGPDFRMGFWQGIHLSEMHLQAKHFQHPRIMDEWISTFHPTADWFRLGVWYPWDHEIHKAAPDEFTKQTVDYIRALYGIFAHVRWTSDNNFREFYEA